MMSKIKVLPFVGILAVVASVWFLYSHSIPTSTQKTGNQNQSTEVTATHFSLKQSLHQPRLQPGEQIKTSESQNPACLEFWSEVQKLDLDQLSFPPKLLKVPEVGGCVAAPESLSEFQSEYMKKCAPLFSDSFRAPETEGQWKQELGPCVASLYMLRAGISAMQAKGQKLSEINDLRLLTDLLASTFGKAMGTKPAAGEMIAVAERILEIDPKFMARKRHSPLESFSMR